MNTASILGALVLGMLLGTVHFGGLWLTIQQLAATRRPARLLIASFLARGGIVMFGLYVVTENHWECLAISIFGFLIARSWLIGGFDDKGTFALTLAECLAALRSTR